MVLQVSYQARDSRTGKGKIWKKKSHGTARYDFHVDIGEVRFYHWFILFRRVVNQERTVQERKKERSTNNSNRNSKSPPTLPESNPNNRVKMQLWLHVPYYSRKSPYISILSYILLHICGSSLFRYSNFSMYGQSRVQYSNFLASRRVDVSVLFQARVKRGVMQRCAT